MNVLDIYTSVVPSPWHAAMRAYCIVTVCLDLQRYRTMHACEYVCATGARSHRTAEILARCNMHLHLVTAGISS